MFIKIPFESEIEFKSNISEITKMSLEHDFNINDGVVLGNFYISGEYKCHEVSVNTDEFKYTLPFTVELRNDIDRSSLEFNIEDFSYEVVKNNTLKVNIEYSLEGSLIENIEDEEELFERVDEDDLEQELALIDEVLDEDIQDDEETKEEIVELKEEIKNDEEEKIEKEVEESTESDRLSEQEEKTIMETIQNDDDTFVTYHVHIVKESESLEAISTIYNVPASLISEYNDVESINTGDKILIPKCDE